MTKGRTKVSIWLPKEQYAEIERFGEQRCLVVSDAVRHLVGQALETQKRNDERRTLRLQIDMEIHRQSALERARETAEKRRKRGSRPPGGSD